MNRDRDPIEAPRPSSSQSSPPPPPPPPPSSSSRRHAPPQPQPQPQPPESSGLTWLDFLRTAGGTVPHHRSPPPPPPTDRNHSAERKRRHAGSTSEAERRNAPYPTYHGGRTMETWTTETRTTETPRASGSSRDGRHVVVDLTSPPPLTTRRSLPRLSSSYRQHHHSRANDMAGRRDSDLVLPPWQPDYEVSKCPVCDTEFTLLYRRHHCRKCGRVVCAKCSPHRITIPRQYIVQPPNPYEDEAFPVSSSLDPSRNPALGGGEVVRVCKPCVPDPWTPDAIASTAATTSSTLSSTSTPVPVPFPAHTTSTTPSHTIRSPTSLQDSAMRHGPDRYRAMFMPSRSARNRSQTQFTPQQRRHLPDFEALLATASNVERQVRNERYAVPPAYRNHRYTQSSEPNSNPVHPSQSNYVRNLPFTRPAPTPPFQPPSGPPRPRRQVREEDECPVCGEEMAPGDAIREQHIQDCIVARMAPHKLPSTSPVVSSSANTPLAAGTPPIAEASRPRATSFRPRGMVKSLATEKDCIDANGEARECPICYEDFQPGDELGRMECMCLFHRACIRDWWDRKGVGNCPTPHFD